MHFLRGFLSVIFTVGVVSPGFCGVGDVDNRYYVTDEMWTKPPYNSFVKLAAITKRSPNGSYWFNSCTAQYVAKNLIVSAGHCTEDKPIEYEITNYKKQTFPVRLLHTPYGGGIGELGDWAIFLVEDPQYYGDAFFDLVTPTQTTKVINAGYGYVRVLTAKDISAIRQILGNENVNEVVDFKDFLEKFENELRARNIESLDHDSDRLKASECNVVFEDCSRSMTSASNNQRLPCAEKFPQILATTCDSWQGNSGGGYVSGNKLYGICSYGADSFADYRNTDYIASTQQYLDKINEFKRQYPVSGGNTNQNQTSQPVSRPPVETVPQLTSIAAQILPMQQLPSQLPTSLGTITEPTPEPTEEDIETLTQQLEDQSNNVMNGVSAAATLSDDGILSLVNNIAECKVTQSRLDVLLERYNAAKEKEQSLANRTLTAASTAATGLGMMAAASAYSEKKADEDAEQDMKAYLATFRCEYGRGQSVKSSAEEVTLPGGNELVEYYQEYKSLADNLKNTKKALGLRAGIESEVVYDKAESNLYKYSSVGKTSGAFTSLSRALTDPEGEDAAAWNVQKEETAKKLKTGAIAAGAGVVGGVAGDYLINHRKGGSGTETSRLLDGVDGSGLLSGIGGQLGSALGNVAGDGTETQDGVEETPEETPEGTDEETEEEVTDTPVPASAQVSEVLSQPWNWLFASKDSTEFDGATRTVKYQGQDLQKTAEDTIKADTEHVADFLKKDTTNAAMQCITIDSRPESFAEIVKARYEQDLPDLVPDIKYEFNVNKGHLYGCDDEAEVCDNIVTHVYNRPCGE